MVHRILLGCSMRMQKVGVRVTIRGKENASVGARRDKLIGKSQVEQSVKVV